MPKIGFKIFIKTFHYLFMVIGYIICIYNSVSKCSADEKTSDPAPYILSLQPSVVPEDSDKKNDLYTFVHDALVSISKQNQQNKDQNPFTKWELKVEKLEDNWLNNDYIPELIVECLGKDNLHQYNIINPVDVHSNWWNLTSQILQSIQNQLDSEQKKLSPFMIVPINFGNVHWAALVIEQNLENISEPSVYFFDSLGSNPEKIKIIEKIITDTQLFKKPNIIDLSPDQLIQKDGHTCGTWMIQATGAIIKARMQGVQDEQLKTSIQQTLGALSIENLHQSNLAHQGKKGIQEPGRFTVKSEEGAESKKVKKEKRDLSGDDVWLGKEGVEPKLFSASTTAEFGHPNQEGDLNKIIKDILESSNISGSLKLKQLHEMAYQKLFEMEEYKKFGSINYAFSYDTNAKRVYSLNFLHLFVAEYEPGLLKLALTKCQPNLINIFDSQGNNILHLAAYYGFAELVDIIIAHAKEHHNLSMLINDRNDDGTNPFGMFFLNYEKILKENRLPTARLFIMEPDFEINRYLNNKRGMDVFAPQNLKQIGGLNCLHVVLLEKYEKLWNLLLKRSKLKSPEAVNFDYPAMNPQYHMFHPRKLAALLPTTGSNAGTKIKENYEKQLLRNQDTEDDDSGDSDVEETPAWYYKKSLIRLSQFIESGNSTSHQPQVDTTILNFPSKTPLNPQEKANKETNRNKVSIAHFHGVPFMQGQLTNSERRDVGKKFIEINQEYMAHGLKNSPKNEKLKGIYTRTTTASCGIENHKMLIDSSEEELDELVRINQLLRELLATFYRASINQDHNFFLPVIQKYINSFTSPDLMPSFWNSLISAVGAIPEKIVQYRFPLTSTSKAPDHAFKYGMGYSVEADRGEKRISPQYEKGIPKHRLAGFLYLIMTDLTSYRDMENERQIVDAIQHHKADQLKLHANIVHQSEMVFLGGVDGGNVALVIPLIYLNFREQNKDFYKNIFNLSDEDWNKGLGLQGSIETLTKGNNHTVKFRLLLKIYLPFIIKIAKTVSHLQDKVLHFVDSYGNLNLFSENTVNLQSIFCTTVQDSIKNQVHGKSPEGKIKTPTKSRKIYHDIEPEDKSLAKKILFEGRDTESQESNNVKSENKVTNEDIDLYKQTAKNGDEQALNKLKSLAEQGNPHAQFSLGRMYRKGTGVGQDDGQAVAWYIKAAEQGHAEAQYYLGFMYESGSGTKQNNEEAINWYTKASNQGDKSADKKLQRLNKK